MKKLNLAEIADEFELISNDTYLFYNIETGEFEYYNEFMETDVERFEEDCWISAPGQYDINEYDMMVDFTDTVANQRKNELLCVALEGRGAFRRFKDTLRRVGLTDKWYEFRRLAYIEAAREWCENNELEYE